MVFTRKRIAVFLDGCFWHRCPLHGSEPRANGKWWKTKLGANVARDRRNDAALAAAGWQVLRFWAHESIDAMVARVSATKRGSGLPGARRSSDRCKTRVESADRGEIQN